MTQIAKVAVAAATYAIDKPYDYLVPEELTAEVKVLIAEVGATSMTEMGKVMGVASKRLAGRADGKDISAKVKELLS